MGFFFLSILKSLSQLPVKKTAKRAEKGGDMRQITLFLIFYFFFYGQEAWSENSKKTLIDNELFQAVRPESDLKELVKEAEKRNPSSVGEKTSSSPKMIKGSKLPEEEPASQKVFEEKREEKKSSLESSASKIESSVNPKKGSNSPEHSSEFENSKVSEGRRSIAEKKPSSSVEEKKLVPLIQESLFEKTLMKDDLEIQMDENKPRSTESPSITQEELGNLEIYWESVE